MSLTTTTIKPLTKSKRNDHSPPVLYKVTYFNARWFAEPIRFVLCYLGEEFEDVRMEWGEWEKGSYDKSVYRYAKTPSLEERETASSPPSFTLGQSFAILRYLGRKYNLVGKSLPEEAKCDEISDCLNDILTECTFVANMAPPKSDDKEKLAEHEKQKEELVTTILTLTIPRYFDVFEKDLKDKKAARDTNDKTLPLVGDNLTWLDFQFAHFSEEIENYLKKIKTPKQEDILEKLFAGYPMIKEHQKWVFGLEGVKEWRESRPVTEY